MIERIGRRIAQLSECGVVIDEIRVGLHARSVIVTDPEADTYLSADASTDEVHLFYLPLVMSAALPFNEICLLAKGQVVESFEIHRDRHVDW